MKATCQWSSLIEVYAPDSVGVIGIYRDQDIFSSSFVPIDGTVVFFQ